MSGIIIALVWFDPSLKGYAMRKSLNAFTLLELIVVLVIIVILLGLLLPWLDSCSRIYTRRNECSTHAKNLVLAFIQYENTKGQFPGHVMDFGSFGLEGRLVDPSEPDADRQSLRPHRKIGTWAVAILPWLDAQPTYEHWTEDRYPIVGGGTAENPLSTGVSGEGYTWIAAPNLAIMQCASNPVEEATHGRNSYIVNTGVYLPPYAKTEEAFEIIQPSGQRIEISFTESMSPSFGIFHNQLPDTVGPDGKVVPTGPPIRISDITDGQGQTVLVSENVQAMPWHRAGFSDQDSLAIVQDRSLSYPTLSRFTNGMVWHDVDWDAGEKPQSVHQINGASELGNESTGIFVLTMSRSNASDLARPSSAHADGVNCGMADGGMRFVSDTIDLRVWQAMMTPAGDDFDSEEAQSEPR